MLPSTLGAFVVAPTTLGPTPTPITSALTTIAPSNTLGTALNTTIPSTYDTPPLNVDSTPS